LKAQVIAGRKSDQKAISKFSPDDADRHSRWGAVACAGGARHRRHDHPQLIIKPRVGATRGTIEAGAQLRALPAQPMSVIRTLLQKPRLNPALGLPRPEEG